MKLYRTYIIAFQLGLFISGITAFFIPEGISIVQKMISVFAPSLSDWLSYVSTGIHQTNEQFKFIYYGTDWLAFAHILFALLFIGPLKDPIRNKWVLQFGLIACLLIFPTALIAGWVRDIPLIWRFLDMAFGIIGIIILSLAFTQLKKIQPSYVTN